MDKNMNMGRKEAHLIFMNPEVTFGTEVATLQAVAGLHRRRPLDGALVDQVCDWPTLKEYLAKNEIPQRVVPSGTDRVKATQDFTRTLSHERPANIAYIAYVDTQQEKIDFAIALTETGFDFAHRYNV